MTHPTAAEVSAALGELVTAERMTNNTSYRAANGNGFHLLHTSTTTAENIAANLRRKA